MDWLWQHRVAGKSVGSNTVPVQVRSPAPFYLGLKGFRQDIENLIFARMLSRYETKF